MTAALALLLAISLVLVVLAIIPASGTSAGRIRRAQQRELWRIRTRAARAQHQLDTQAFAARRALLEIARRDTH